MCGCQAWLAACPYSPRTHPPALPANAGLQGYRARPASRLLSHPVWSHKGAAALDPFPGVWWGGRDSGGRGQSLTHQKLLVLSPERREQKPGPGQVGWVSASCDKLCEPGSSRPSGLWNESIALDRSYPPASSTL